MTAQRTDVRHMTCPICGKPGYVTLVGGCTRCQRRAYREASTFVKALIHLWRDAWTGRP